MKRIVILTFTLCLLCSSLAFAKEHDNSAAQPQNSIPVSAPITDTLAGQQSMSAVQSVVRVICKSTGMGGTGFFHRSGKIITAAHVVEGCPAPNLLILTSSGKSLQPNSVVTDFHFDLALIGTAERNESVALPIARTTEIAVGTPIVTWGFPAGYNGFRPLLTFGYLSGVDFAPTQSGNPVARWVVNAAFNGGNSGGPVINNQTGEVVGVVDSKLAPIPPTIESALNALSAANWGLMYNAKTPDGKILTLSEGQVVGSVLTYLRSQTQLVLGQAVTSNDLMTFLKTEGVE